MVELLNPDAWTIWEYLIVGGILTVAMLVLGYAIGVLWQRMKDRAKTR